jgi:hypothetical protein
MSILFSGSNSNTQFLSKLTNRSLINDQMLTFSLFFTLTLLPAHCRRKVLLLHLITHTHT